MNLGSLMRRYRKAGKLTLKAVAEKAGISEGFLSQVENSVSSPSVDTLIGICNAIGVSAGDLLNHVDREERLVVIRKSDWLHAELPKSGFVTRRFLSPENRSVIDSAVLVLEPGKSIPVRKEVRNGQEVLSVLEGSLELIQGESRTELLKGDSVHFWSYPEKQSITNRGKGLAVALWVGTL